MRSPAPTASMGALAFLMAAMSTFPVDAASDPPRGAIAGKVYDKETQSVVPDAMVNAFALTSGEEFQVQTDDGTYFLENAPASVYSFSLRVGDTEYPVQERIDVRVGMTFVLQSCFELDRESETAYVRAECDTKFVDESRLETIGPHRFLRPAQERAQRTQRAANPDVVREPAVSPESPTETPDDTTEPVPEPETAPEPVAEDSDVSAESSIPMPDAILHDELECLTYDHFPLVDANIAPGATVQISRVYFRSDKYPDFYYVDMGPDNPTIDDFRAILPKPSRETERIYYYVESVDSEFNSLQTAEFDPEVLEVQDCKDRGAAWFQGEEPGIVVGATEGSASAIPPGFQAAGITGFVSSLGVLTSVSGAAGGGVAASTTGLVLVVSGGAAAAAGTTIAVTGEEEASPPK